MTISVSGWETRQNTEVILGKLGRCSRLYWENEVILIYWENWAGLLGNGVGEGKERPAHAIGESVEQDPEQEHFRLLCPVQNVNITD